MTKITLKTEALVEAILLFVILWNLPHIPSWKWFLYVFSIVGLRLEWGS